MSENKVNLHSHLINHFHTMYIIIYSSLVQTTVKILAEQSNHFLKKKKSPNSVYGRIYINLSSELSLSGTLQFEFKKLR